MTRRLLIALLVGSLASACARNGALEIELALPAQPAEAPPLFAVLQLETGDESFERAWVSSDAYPGVPLGDDVQSARYSVLSEDPELVVLVKVLFCRTETCSAIEDAPDRAPAVWYRLARSLYVGQRTWWRPAIEAVPEGPPNEPIAVGKCEIEGCIRASAETTFCRLSGAHFCE